MLYYLPFSRDFFFIYGSTHWWALSGSIPSIKLLTAIKSQGTRIFSSIIIFKFFISLFGQGLLTRQHYSKLREEHFLALQKQQWHHIYYISGNFNAAYFSFFFAMIRNNIVTCLLRSTFFATYFRKIFHTFLHYLRHFLTLARSFIIFHLLNFN